MDKKEFLKNQTVFDPVEALERLRVNISKEIQPPLTILSCQGSPLATLGNLSLIIGKAKVKKTFLIGSVVAAAICGRGSIFCIKGEMPSIYTFLIDTEQAPYHLSRTVDRIIRQVGGTIPKNLAAYGLRPLTPAQRVQVIEKIISDLDRPALIIIDGLRDLLTHGINDEEEATSLISKFLKWTYEKDCHIMLVLHQNKTDQNARGHIGTEAVNKAETVISVARDDKNRDISIVTAEYCRDIDFTPFYFSIDEAGLPYEVDQIKTTENRKHTVILDNFKRILPGMIKRRYTDLVNEYCEISGTSGVTAKRHISIGLKSGILSKGNDGLISLQMKEEYQTSF